MGVIIKLKSNVFKQGNKISLNPIYPIYLKDLTVVNTTSVEVVSNK